MGAGMAQRVMKGGHECMVYDVRADAVESLVHRGAIGAASLQDLVAGLTSPRIMWLMVPAAIVDQTLAMLVPLLEAGDIVVDGGNSITATTSSGPPS
jgi:6-phosphogluconate dehydrogenase